MRSISKGITSFQDAGSSFEVVDRVKRAIDAGRMNVRLWMMIRGGTAQSLAAGRVIGYGNNMLTVRAIKITADGALGSRGAWLLEPYSDKADSVGLATTPVEQMRQQAQVALDAGYQVCIHAIGDRANREVLNIYEEAFKKNGRNGKDLRWRIEHAQHISGADIPRFGQLGVIAAMQGVHCTSDAPWVEPRLGAKRAEEGAYVWQKLMKSGAVVTNGTDAPVEDVDPIASYYATVTRKAGDGKVFYGDQKMSRIEALRSYTIQNAFAAFEEDQKGTLSLGKLADITVLTKDITTVPDEEIKTGEGRLHDRRGKDRVQSTVTWSVLGSPSPDRRAERRTENSRTGSVLDTPELYFVEITKWAAASTWANSNRLSCWPSHGWAPRRTAWRFAAKSSSAPNGP